MADVVDVEVVIGKAEPSGAGQGSRHAIEVRVDGDGPWKYDTTFDFVSLDPSDPKTYGVALGAQLAKPTLLRALDHAGLTRGGRIRFRLVLDDDKTAPHWVRWERMWLRVGGDWPVGIHPNVTFSRHIRVEQPDGEPPDAPFFRLLITVANPTGLDDEKQIDVSAELNHLLDEFDHPDRDRRLQVSVFAGRTGIADAVRARIRAVGWTLVADGDGTSPRPATLQNVSDELHRAYHALHVIAHGDFNPDQGVGSLLLEDEQGGKHLVHDEDLQAWITPDLQLIVFQSCLSAGAQAEGKSPFTGLAPHLIRLGLPSAVAMQDYVAMEDARRFLGVFYRTLLDDGFVDVAVNNGRQVLKTDASLDNWSIPALLSRLRSGRLWRPDPLRLALVAAFDRLPDDEMKPWPPMLQVIEHTRGVADYDPVRGGTGPRFNLWQRLCDAANTRGATAILSGPRGAFKAAQLRRLFRFFGTAFRDARDSGPMPVLVTLAELAAGPSEAWPIFGRVWSGRPAPDAARLNGRRFVFLVDAEEELPGPARESALAAIERLQQTCPDSAVIIAADEVVLPSLQRVFSGATLLISQPLGAVETDEYLRSFNDPEISRLAETIRERGYGDLASQPRFLQHILELTGRKVPLPSRRAVLECVAEIYLARLTTRQVPRSCLEDAAERIAWEIQNTAAVAVAAPGVYGVLTTARAGRELGLAALKHALVDECRLLVPSGDEGVRFAYRAMQSYFAALYLVNAPNRRELLDDITASLGRLARLRRWEPVLVLLGGLLPNAGDLLGAILAGSSLMEGEQLFLAVRCYQETVADRRSPAGRLARGADNRRPGSRESLADLDHVLHQLIDALIWRSSWDPARTYADRRKSLDRLIELSALLFSKDNERDHRQVIGHLVTLACDPIASDGTGAKYDWAGIRQAAAYGLLALYPQTSAYVRQHRTDLVDTLDAWWKLSDAPDAMKDILLHDDPGCSVIAAFALASTSSEADRTFLIEAYSRVQDRDVLWGIVNALSAIEANWVHEHVVAPWMTAVDLADRDANDLRAAHVCFLIQRTSFAGDGARAYLSRCLMEGAVAVQGRALRAFSKLGDPATDAWLRTLCEQIVSGATDRIDPGRIRLRDGASEDVELQRSALEALRDVGTLASIDIVRRARVGRLRERQLQQLSFQVCEEMYWRLTGGLDAETYAAAIVPQ